MAVSPVPGRAASGGLLRGGRCLGLLHRRRLRLKDLALEDPHLDADYAIGGARLRESVIDFGAEGVQRDAALAVPLRTRDLRAVEATRHPYLHAQRAAAHRVHDGALHRAAEHHAALDLLRDPFGDELRIDFGLADLRDVDTHVGDGHAHHLRDLETQPFDVLTLLADHDTRTRGLDRDVCLAGGALDVNAAHRGLGQLL